MSAEHECLPVYSGAVVIANPTIPGVKAFYSPVRLGPHGRCFEGWSVSNMETTSSLYSIVSFYSQGGTIHGPFAREGEEFVCVIQGRLWARLIDASDYSKRDVLGAESGTIIRIPSGVVREFLPVESDTVFLVIDTQRRALWSNDHHDMNDGCLRDEWPLVAETGSKAFSVSPWASLWQARAAFAIMGSNGLIGSAFVREIERQGFAWYRLRSRLQQHQGIRDELSMVHPTVSVIIAAGVGTRPNSQWCDDHKLETVDANVTCQLAVATICHELALHCTLIGTCGFWHYDKAHPLGSNHGFTEDDPPNHRRNFYCKMRVYLERLLEETGVITSVLNLRAIPPVDQTLTKASLIGKLLDFETVYSIETSMTVLPVLVPLALDMMRAREFGHVNWVCQGTATNGDVLRAYQASVDPSITINEICLASKESGSVGNSAAYIVPARLTAAFGPDRVPQLHDAIQAVMKMIKATTSKTPI